MLESTLHGNAASRSTARGPLAGTRFLAAFHHPEERFALDAVAQPAREYRVGVDLVREGDAIDRLFVLTEGWACRYKTTREGSRQIVALVVPGDIANLDTLLFGRPDSACARSRRLRLSHSRAMRC